MGRTLYTILTGMTLLLAGCATPGSPAAEQANWTTPLEALGITATPEVLDQPAGWTVRQAVYSTGRGAGGLAPLEGIEDPDAVVLADLQGPGCVLRLWAARPSGVLSVYIDDQAEPVLRAALVDVFAGRPKVFETLSGRAGDAGYAHVPMPYKTSCRLVLTGAADPGEVQVTYATFPPETYLLSFRPKLGPRDRHYFERARREWANAAEVRFYDRDTETYHKTTRNLWPDEDVQVWVMDGPGTITELEMQLSAKDPAILNKIWLSVFWEGQSEPAIQAPVGDFFGGATSGGPNYGGPAFGHTDGRMWCRFPMPFRQRAQIRMNNRSKDKVEFSYGVTWRPGDEGSGYHLHALHRDGAAPAGQPFEALHVVGSGRFVGSTLRVSGLEPGFLGGTAFVMADGANSYEPAPLGQYFGTDAVFGTGLFSAPSHGCTRITPSPDASLTAYRAAIADAVPFQGEFALLFEPQSRGDGLPMTFASTVYWYQ